MSNLQFGLALLHCLLLVLCPVCFLWPPTLPTSAYSHYTLCSVEKGSHLGDGIVVAFSEIVRWLSIRFELLVGV